MTKKAGSVGSDLTGKRVLVTGGASGIGFEAAKALAEQGADVLIADWNDTLGPEAVSRIRQHCANASVAFRKIDLSQLAGIHTFAQSMLDEGRPLDILINNAGIQSIAERRVSADGFELTFAIGHIGHFLLTGLLLPLLEKAPAARVVTVSSMVHGRGWFDWDDLQIERGYASQRAYNQTKLANLLFAQELQRKLTARGSAVRSIAVHPGVARTSIGANRRGLGKFRLADHIVSFILSMVMPWLGQDSAAGALPTIYAAASPDAVGGGFYGPDGFGEMKGFPAPARIKPSAKDSAAAARLWQVSEQLAGITYPA